MKKIKNNNNYCKNIGNNNNNKNNTNKNKIKIKN